MTTSVDVLSVMARDATAAWNDRRGDREIQDFLGNESNEARAAVAELIEAATVVETADRDGCLDDEIVQRMRIALARVKGV